MCVHFDDDDDDELKDQKSYIMNNKSITGLGIAQIKKE
jgi:hypothetical protein